MKVSEDPERWRARTYYRFRDGKRRQVERFRPTKAKAEQALKSDLRTIERGSGGTISPSTRLNRLAERFLEEKTAANRSDGTITTYTVAVRAHIKPDIGDLSIDEATPELLQDFLGSIAKDHGHGAAKNCRSVLSGMFGIAVRNGAAERNPVRELERISKPGKVGSAALLPENLSGFLEAVDSDDKMVAWGHNSVFRFMAGTGLRIGEVCALTWDRLNFEGKTITIDRTAVRIKGEGMVLQDHPKTSNSSRTISVAQDVVDLLLGIKARNEPASGDTVFPTLQGKIQDPSNVQRDWRERREELGYPQITTHSFRKLVATLLDEAGLSARDVADYLGHEDPSVTQDVYMARNRESKRAASVIARAFSSAH